MSKNHPNGVNPLLTAKAVQGNVIGLAHGVMIGELRDPDSNAGIPGQLLNFAVTDTGEALGSGTTDRTGQAKISTGSRILDVFGMIGGAASGYTVSYDGDEKYNPASAPGSFVASLG
jgi:hypothetical protein